MKRSPFAPSLLLAVLLTAAVGRSSPLLAQLSPANPPYPAVQAMIWEPLDNVPNGTIACGWAALRYRMSGNIYQSSPGRLDNSKLTQFERLVLSEPEDVAAVILNVYPNHVLNVSSQAFARPTEGC